MGIEWRESLAVGVEGIDRQHRELLSQFDGLLKACESGRGIAELQTLLGFLDRYVVNHFSDEEALQRQHNYPGYEAHKRQHDLFVARLRSLEEEIASQGAALHHVIETNGLLLKWLLQHISTVDVQLGAFLREQGG